MTHLVARDGLDVVVILCVEMSSPAAVAKPRGSTFVSHRDGRINFAEPLPSQTFVSTLQIKKTPLPAALQLLSPRGGALILLDPTGPEGF